MKNVKAVDIESALSSLEIMEGRTPHSPEEQVNEAFATLAPFDSGGVFVGAFVGDSPWERHAAGDELLCEISDILRKHLQNRGLLARLGGDEFGILLRNCDADEVMALSQELCRSIKRFEFLRGGHNFNVGVSIGVMMIDRHVKSVESVVSCADQSSESARRLRS